MLLSKNKRRIKKKIRIRKKIFGTDIRPRLVVFRSINNIYGQIVDDIKGHTLISASSMDKEIKKDKKKKSDVSEIVGSLIAEKAVSKGIKEVVFDRNGYLYHGRVKSLAEAAREEGLKF